MKKHTLGGYATRLLGLIGVIAILGTSYQCLSAEDADLATLRALLARQLPQPPDDIRPTPVPGLYEATFGGSVVYFSADGRYAIQGELLDIAAQTNLTQQRAAMLRKSLLAGVPAEEFIVFKARKPLHEITVFTDIDCGYCRKLHAELDEYLRRGITIKYLAYPRAGKDSPSYRKAVNVWCADDRGEALTIAKKGGKIAERACANPVARHMLLANRLGVQGTPAIFLDDGRILGGYLPADKLAQQFVASPN